MRPGLVRAVSSRSILFVAPITNIPFADLNPSRLTNNSFNVESCSVFDA